MTCSRKQHHSTNHHSDYTDRSDTQSTIYDMSTKISKVALLGADGKLGPAIMHALVENGFNVTVLKRKSSKSPSSYPSQISISDDFSVPELVEALKGMDAIVITVKGSQIDLQKRIAEAAVQAGVRRKRPFTS